MHDAVSEHGWKWRLATAEQTVSEVWRSLPAELRALAESLPVVFQRRPGDEAPHDDLLGLFIGDPVGIPDGERGVLPAQIFIYIDNLWEDVDGDPREFESEVRITYLHELGHYVGWDEDDLTARDLG